MERGGFVSTSFGKLNSVVERVLMANFKKNMRKAASVYMEKLIKRLLFIIFPLVDLLDDFSTYFNLLIRFFFEHLIPWIFAMYELDLFMLTFYVQHGESKPEVKSFDFLGLVNQQWPITELVNRIL